MIIGYARVSTVTQNIDRQIKALKDIGAELIYMDKMSGKDTKRPELQKMMNYVREGDTVVVTEFSRFSRNTRDLLSLVEQLAEKNVEFKSVKEAIDTTTVYGRLVLTIFGALSEFERDMIRERQREGLLIAKAQGKKLGRKCMEIDEKKFIKMYKQWKKGDIPQKAIMKEFGFSRNTLNNRIRKLKEAGKIK